MQKMKVYKIKKLILKNAFSPIKQVRRRSLQNNLNKKPNKKDFIIERIKLSEQIIDENRIILGDNNSNTMKIRMIY